MTLTTVKQRVRLTRVESLVLTSAALAILLFTTLRLFVAAHGVISRFVAAGMPWTASSRVQHFLAVTPRSDGYDGQFYWRLATAPWHLTMARFNGVAFDSSKRAGRIFYSFLAWMLSFNDAHLVVWTLVLVNIFALLALVYIALRTLRAYSANPWWALSVLLVPGLIGSLSRDLTEIVATLCVVAGLALWRNDRWVLAGLCFAGGGLTREVNMVVVPVLAALAVVSWARRQRKPDERDLAWVLPLVIFVAWQLVCKAATGAIPVLSSSKAGDLGMPFLGLVRGVRFWFSPWSTHQFVKGVYYSLETATSALGAVTLVQIRRTLSVVEFWVAAGFFMLAICETQQGWMVPFDNRYATVPMVLVWLALLRPELRAVAKRNLLVIAPVVALTLVWRVAVI
jgi:hypothetical protein